MMNQARPATERSPQSGEQAILKAAEILFAEKGFDAVSMSAIAELAKTSKPNIYHHFKNKNDLYLAVMKTAVHRSSALLDQLEATPGTSSQHLSDFSAGQLSNILAHKLGTQLTLRDALAGGSIHGRDIAKHVVGEIFTRLVAMVRQGQEDGEFRRDMDPALAAFMVIASNMFYFQAEAVMQHIPETNITNDPGKFSSGVMDILLNGILQEGEDTL